MSSLAYNRKRRAAAKKKSIQYFIEALGNSNLCIADAIKLWCSRHGCLEFYAETLNQLFVDCDLDFRLGIDYSGHSVNWTITYRGIIIHEHTPHY